MNINENVINKITDEQKKKAEAARSPEELLSIAKESGYELTPEELSQVAGGKMPGNCSQYTSDEPWLSSW